MLAFLPTIILSLLSTQVAQAAPIPISQRSIAPRIEHHKSLSDYMEYDPATGTYRAIMGGMNNLMVGAMDPQGNRRRRRNCIFYVNQRPPMTEADDNWAKKRARQFARLMNLAQSGGDYHTLYEIYDLDAAFNPGTGGPMADALESGLKRVWFQTTSQAFANLCEGTVYLVAEPEEIWAGSIWLTHEVNALFQSGAIQEIWEIRPADIGHAWVHGGSVYQIPKTPYRGGQPGGSTPPRDLVIDIPDVPRPEMNDPTDQKILSLNLDTSDPGEQPPVGVNKEIPPTPPPPPSFHGKKSDQFCEGDGAVAISITDPYGHWDNHHVLDRECKTLDSGEVGNICTEALKKGSTFGCSPEPVKITTMRLYGRDEFTCKESRRVVECKSPLAAATFNFCCVPAAK